MKGICFPVLIGILFNAAPQSGFALPISQVGKACWSQLANGNAASAVDMVATGVELPSLTVQATTSFENGMNKWQQDGASYSACMDILDGASKTADIALLGTEAGATGLSLVAEGTGYTAGAAAGGAVLRFIPPLALASLAGTGLAACINGVSEADARYSLKCMEEEHGRLNDDGLDCSWFDRQIARKRETLANLPKDATDAKKTIEDSIQDLEKRKAACKASREKIRDALSVGDCTGPGMDSDVMVMRCESIRSLFCSNDPRWARRKKRLEATFTAWGIEYIHCGTPIAQPTPTTAPEEQFYLY
jgi:phage terminase large subunit-like protein